MLPITGYSINHLTHDMQCLLLTLYVITKKFFMVWCIWDGYKLGTDYLQTL